jgi:hypothetical protein
VLLGANLPLSIGCPVKKGQKGSISRPQWLAVDRQIRGISAGSGDPAGADCGVLSIDEGFEKVVKGMCRTG